jgi:hypothetical protein
VPPGLGVRVSLDVRFAQEAHLVELYRVGEHTIGELEELFPVTRSTIYRAVARAGGRAMGRATQSPTR